MTVFSCSCVPKTDSLAGAGVFASMRLPNVSLACKDAYSHASADVQNSLSILLGTPAMESSREHIWSDYIFGTGADA